MRTGRCSPDARDSSSVASSAESKPRARVRLRPLALAVGAAFALGALFAPAAFAVRKVQIAFSCGSATFTYSGFPDAENNVVAERLKSDGIPQFNEKFSFNGSSGSDTIPMSLPSGRHKLTAEAHWKTNGVTGESGAHKEHLNCGAEAMPAFTIQKLQAIAGSGKPFGAIELNGQVGNKVEYEIVVSNTGNVPFTLNGFTDPNCDPGTLAGGPGVGAVAPADSTTYTCSHVLAGGGSYSNTASVTAEFAEAPPVTHSSNTVVVKVASQPRLALEKSQEIDGSGGGFTSSTLTAAVGQTVLYQIVAKNTGNVTLTLSEFTDLYCDEHTLAGGQSTIAPGASATWTCRHKITETLPYFNIASVTGTPSGGAPLTVASNTVNLKVTESTPQTPAPSTTTNPGQPGSPGTPGSTGTSGSSGSHPSTGSGTLAAKAKKKHKRVTTVQHKTPRFTG